jgi:hypothetical protein
MIEVFPGDPSLSGSDRYKLSLRKGRNSTPGSGPISIGIKLAITLRILAGASTLDMHWYGVQHSTVTQIFLWTLKLVDKALPEDEIFRFNPSSPTFLSDLQLMAEQFADIRERKYRNRNLMNQETIGAIDGIVIKILAPKEEELGEKDLATFRNRKNCWALIAQGMCDAHGRFRYFDVNNPGSNPDIVCFKQTLLHQLITKEVIPSKYHMVGDEAYSSLGTDSVLCPFTRCQLLKAKKEDYQKYLKMRGFNFMLSSERITIERAFGMLVAKFAILSHPLNFKLKTNIDIVMICAKLHNVSINCYLEENPGEEFFFLAPDEIEEIPNREEAAKLCNPDVNHDEDDAADPEHKATPIEKQLKKMAIAEYIWSCGLRFADPV